MKSEALKKIQEAAYSPENIDIYMGRIQQVKVNTGMYNLIGTALGRCRNLVALFDCKYFEEVMKTDTVYHQLKGEFAKLLAVHATSNVIRLGNVKTAVILLELKTKVEELEQNLKDHQALVLKKK